MTIANLEEPLVSVVIPTYNRGRMVVRAIKSCQNQTYRNIEIIVCNDHSTDDTVEIIKNMMKDDSRIVLCDSDEGHKGANAARNAGIRIANGKYFCFLDSDDVLTENSIGTRVAVFEKDSELGMVYGNSIIQIANKYFPAKHVDVSNDINKARKYLFTELSLCSQVSMMIRLKPYRAIGVLNENQKGWTDDGVAIEVGTNYKVAHCHEYVCIIRKTKMSITSNKSNLSQGLEFLIDKYKNDIISTVSYGRYLLWIARLWYLKMLALEYKSENLWIKYFLQRILRPIRKYLQKYFDHWFE